MSDKRLAYYRITALTASVIVLLLLGFAWINESIFIEYKGIQKEYREAASAFHPDFELVALPSGVHQTHLPALNRNDRCMTCHRGITSNFEVGGKEHFNPHPGNYLKDHPVEDFGCTICHGGQGLATNSKEAHATDPDVKWPYPLLSQPFIQSSCGQCHLTLFDSPEAVAGTEVLVEGHQIFTGEGCLGCHKARGVGGYVGPDLTEQGEKTRYEYNFRHIDGEQSVANWLKQHFKDPEMVSPGSRMLKIDLHESDLDALATYTMGLFKPDIHFRYFSKETLDEFMGERKLIDEGKVFGMICSACHGKEGEGKDYLEYETGVPAIGNLNFRQVMYRDFIRFTILQGRSGSQMASWLPVHSGLFEEEIHSITDHIMSTKAIHPGSQEASPQPRPISSGPELYKENCLMCHGEDGMGDGAKAITSDGFLKTADDNFIYSTLRLGRPEPGMPSWGHLEADELEHLLDYIRSHGAYQPVSIPAVPDGKAEAGLEPFHYRCSRCHGEFGEGGTGPAIINSSFLMAADDEFIYRTITRGRDHTAMFGWQTAMAGADIPTRQEVADIIAFMRYTAEAGTEYIHPGPTRGNPATGKDLFLRHCAECHGDEGEGKSAPALNNQEFLSGATNGYIFSTTSLGRNGTRMPSRGKGDEKYRELNGKERHDIVAYIRQWQKFKIKRQR
jgi:mono/diheme cytochrome c family protein